MTLDITKIFVPGTVIEKKFQVSPDDAVGNCSLSLQTLLSTQGCVARMIDLVGNYCNSLLPEGFVTASIRLVMDQVAAASTGTVVTVRATIRRVEAHTVAFDVELRDAVGVLVWAENERAVVSAVAMTDRAVARAEKILELRKAATME